MDARDGSGHEMSELPRRNSNSSLLASRQTQGVGVPAEGRGAKFRDCLRQFRLQFLGLIFGRFSRWKSPIERRKVAMYRSREMAAYQSLLHVVPLAGAVTLLCLHWTRYWVGDTSDDSTALQFVAKFHELIMQVSIVDVVLCIIRMELVDGFVPLGALSGALQATQLSYLWSLDFVSVVKSPVLRGRRKIVFVVMIPLLLILTAVVGPSSAILMIPRPGTLHTDAVVTRYAKDSMETLFPSHVDISRLLGVYLPNLSSTIMSGTYNTTFSDSEEGPYCRSHLNRGYSQLRLLRYCAVSGMDEVINSTSYGTIEVNATIPTRFSAESLYNISQSQSLGSTSNGTISVTMAHPVVATHCKSVNSEKNADTNISYIQDSRTSLGILSNLSTLAEQVSGPGETSTAYGVTTQFFPPVWIPSPEAGSHSLISIFTTWESQNATEKLPSLTTLLTDTYSTARQTDLTVTACTTSAIWSTTEVQLLLNSGPMIVQTLPLSISNASNPRPITLNVSDLDVLNGGEFHRLLYDLKLGYDPALAAIFALALSEFPPQNYSLDETAGSSSSSTAFAYTVARWGFGYGQKDTATLLAVGVITAYSVLVVGYVVYMLVSGSASSAWNSGLELVALGLQSKRPEQLGHVSVGIESVHTLQQSVGVRVNAEEKLELVFAQGGDMEKRGLRRIERNKAY